MLWISWQARTQSPQRTHLFWSRTSSWSKQMRSAAITSTVMKFKRWIISRVVVQPRCVVGPRSLSLLILSWLRELRPMCTRMSMDIRVHVNTIHTSLYEISSKTLSTSSLTINAPLIVKDEVDKVFELILFTTKQKILCGLKAYCYLGPACPGPLKDPGQAGPWPILIE